MQKEEIMKQQHIVNSSRPLEIAIIDDEINIDRVDSKCKIRKIRINNDSHSTLNDSNYISHSTIVTKILQTYVDPLISYSITNYIVAQNEQQYFDIEFLIEALKQCAVLKPQIIIMSIGTTIPSNAAFVYPLCQTLVKDGIVIIAATSNDNVFTFPASFSNVIAVNYDPQKENLITVCIRDFLRTNFTVHYRRKEMTNRIGIDTIPSNSFAVPIVAAEVINNYSKLDSLMPLDVINTLRKINKYPVYSSRNICLSTPKSESPLTIKISMKKSIECVTQTIKALKNKYGLEAACLTGNMSSFTRQLYSVPNQDLRAFFENGWHSCIRSDLLLIIGMEGIQFDMKIDIQTDLVLFTIVDERKDYLYEIGQKSLGELIADKIVLLNDIHSHP